MDCVNQDQLYEVNGTCAVLQMQQFYGNGTDRRCLDRCPMFTMRIYLTQTFENEADSTFYKEGIYILAWQRGESGGKK